MSKRYEVVERYYDEDAEEVRASDTRADAESLTEAVKIVKEINTKEDPEYIPEIIEFNETGYLNTYRFDSSYHLESVGF